MGIIVHDASLLYKRLVRAAAVVVCCCILIVEQESKVSGFSVPRFHG